MSAAWFAEALELSAQDDLQPRQKIVAIVLALALLALVIELVRRRKLREEYSVLWIVTAVCLMALAWQYRLLDVVQHATGIVEPQFALFFGGLLFLMLIALQFSVRLSKLTYRNKALTQRVALLERELEDLRDDAAPGLRATQPPREDPRAEPNSVERSGDTAQGEVA